MTGGVDWHAGGWARTKVGGRAECAGMPRGAGAQDRGVYERVPPPIVSTRTAVEREAGGVRDRTAVAAPHSATSRCRTRDTV